MNQGNRNGQQVPLNSAVTVQPGVAMPISPGNTLMAIPDQIPGVPVGLEYLVYLDQVVVHQVKEIVEMVAGVEVSNKYVIKNRNGEQAYFAFEESECCQRVYCGPQRGFDIKIFDNFRREVLCIHRDFKCMAGGCGGLCTGNELSVTSPSHGVLGKVRQLRACCSTRLDILDAEDNSILWIDGPCHCSMIGCGDHEFPIKTKDDKEIGSITKKWSGFIREAFTDADTFAVSWPGDLDVRIKGVLLAATFLVDFMEFESKEKNSRAIRI